MRGDPLRGGAPEAAQARTVTVHAETGPRSSPWHAATVRGASHGTLPILAVRVERLVLTPVADAAEARSLSCVPTGTYASPS